MSMIKELKELTTETLKIFGLNSTADLPDALFTAVMRGDTGKYQQFNDLVGDLSIDWMQKIFQYYEADRKEKKQDYTPRTLAMLAGKLVENEREKTVLDLCAGSGALTIQKWNSNHKLNFVCVEIDKKAVSLLLFNLALRNITATVIHGDALSGEIFETFKLEPGDKYSSVSSTYAPGWTKCDTVISNPPFNIKYTGTRAFDGYCDPPESNANYAFILSAAEQMQYKAALILPNSVLITNNSSEKNIRKQLVENNLIESIIMCPDKMFEATSISTCIMVLNRNKTSKNITFADMRHTYTVEQREQNGQYGGASHENRTYKKNVNVFSDEQIGKAVKHTSEYIDEPGFAKTVTIEEIRQNDYTLIPSKYIEFQERKFEHRPYEDIARDINRLDRDKTVLKLTINETLAKELGFDVELYKHETENSKELEKTFEAVGCKLQHRKYIQFSKNKNEFKIENQDKEALSSILRFFLPMWKQHIYYLNEKQNEFLAEFRDALTNDLMSGKVEISGEEAHT